MTDYDPEQLAKEAVPLLNKLNLHFKNNHKPPLDKSFNSVAILALMLAQHGFYDRKLKHPNGLERTVQETMDELDLHAFINDLDLVSIEMYTEPDTMEDEGE